MNLQQKPNPIFSNDFMSNKIFYDLLVKWDSYSGQPDIQEIVVYDMYREALFWFDIFKDADWWREGLK